MLDLAAAQSSRFTNILNAGSGEGLYSHLLLAMPGVEQVLELDPGYSQRPGPRHAKQAFLAASIPEMPLSDNSVDLILCSEVLEHIVEDDRALNELSRVLYPGGWLLISVPMPPAVFDPAHVREGYYPADLTGRLEEKGFQIVEVRFCMHTAFRFFLRRNRQSRIPRCLILLLSWVDRGFPFGQPMDLIVLARSNRPAKL